MSKEIIKAERLSDERQIQIISEICLVSLEEATKIADKLYSLGCEIVKTESGELVSVEPTVEKDHTYELAKKFLKGEKTIKQMSKEENISYAILYRDIRAVISKASGQSSIWIGNGASRKKYLEFFE